MPSNYSIDQEQIEIPLSKVKIIFLFLGSMAFIALGLFYILNPNELQGSGYRHHSRWLNLAVGYLSIIFFGTGLVVFGFQIFNSNPGLIIDNKGITINPGIFSKTFIEWKLIDKFEIITISRSKLIAIYLKEPKKYIDQLNSPWKKKMATFSLKSCGTPISITANNLKCSTNELSVLLTEKLKRLL